MALAIADGFNLKDTMPVLRAAFPRADLHLISECLHFSVHSEDGEHTEEAYLFDVRQIYLGTPLHQCMLRKCNS